MKKPYRSRKLWALDVFRGQVAVAVGQRKPDGTFEVLGAGSAPATGISRGDIDHLGDEVESVFEAVRCAERSSGLTLEAPYFALDDRSAKSYYFKATRVLEGEGEIQPSDVEDVKAVAQRLGDSFEETPVYTAETGFLIDDKDVILEPVGVFARKIELTLHVMRVRAKHLEDWRTVMRRAGIVQATPVFSPWATYSGILAKDDRKKKRLVVDLAEGPGCFFVLGTRGILEYHAIPAGADAADILDPLKTISDKYPDLEESLLTGENAETGDWAERFNRVTGRPAWLARPRDVGGFISPSESTLAGLLRVADELTARTPLLNRDRRVLSGLKERAISFLNEYF